MPLSPGCWSTLDSSPAVVGGRLLLLALEVVADPLEPGALLLEPLAGRGLVHGSPVPPTSSWVRRRRYQPPGGPQRSSGSIRPPAAGRPGPARGPGRGHHPGEGGGQGLDLLGVEVAGEVLVDAAQVDRGGAAQGAAALVGEDGEPAAAVVLAALPADQPGLHHPVDQPRQPALGEQHRRRQLLHAQPAPRGLGQVEEHVVAAQGQAALGHQLVLEQLGDRGVRLQQQPPGGQLRRIGSRRHPPIVGGRPATHRQHPALPGKVSGLPHGLPSCLTLRDHAVAEGGRTP